MSFDKVTEMPSAYRHLELMSIDEILCCINKEDSKVHVATKNAIPKISVLVGVIADKMLKGGRLIYIGAGTSGRLGVLDASECPPTYGVEADRVIGIMAGGDEALRFGIEDAEDSEELGWKDLQKYEVNDLDVVLGIAASGTTPYVIGALKNARLNGIVTGCLVCNANSPVADYADHAIEVVVGPEFVTGSTRMKSGTAQKLVLNMISTAVMIKIGRVHDNTMVNMQISNEKLVDRGTRMLMQKSGIKSYEDAKALLLTHGSVQEVIDKLK